LRSREETGIKAERQAGVKVGDKGGVSVYDWGRFPVTLYYEQWNKLLDAAEDLQGFPEATKPFEAPAPSLGFERACQ